MRACVQRVSEAGVTVDGETVGSIGRGLVVLLGVAAGDGDREVQWMAQKLVGLRIFPDDEDKMNRSVSEVGGEMLVVSQFTLLGDCRRGKRPSFIDAAPPDEANRLYEQLVKEVRSRGVSVATGRFRAMMQVHLVNDGPVTLIVDSP
jgi:D-tyrosyl-tRNA(Tyr) deacylase